MNKTLKNILKMVAFVVLWNVAIVYISNNVEDKQLAMAMFGIVVCVLVPFFGIRNRI